MDTKNQVEDELSFAEYVDSHADVKMQAGKVTVNGKEMSVEEANEMVNRLDKKQIRVESDELTEKEKRAAEKKIKVLQENSGYVRELIARSAELKAMPEDQRRLEEQKIAKKNFDRIKDAWDALPRKKKRKMRGQDSAYSARTKRRLQKSDPTI